MPDSRDARSPTAGPENTVCSKRVDRQLRPGLSVTADMCALDASCDMRKNNMLSFIYHKACSHDAAAAPNSTSVEAHSPLMVMMIESLQEARRDCEIFRASLTPRWGEVGSIGAVHAGVGRRKWEYPDTGRRHPGEGDDTMLPDPAVPVGSSADACRS